MSWQSEKAERAVRRDINAFLRTFDRNCTYYTVVKRKDALCGEYEVLHEYKFDTVKFGVGEYDSKMLVPLRRVWYQEGPLYADRDAPPCAGLLTLGEHQASVDACDGPDIKGSLHDYAAKRRQTAGRK